MQFGEAFLSLTPQLNQAAVRLTEAQARAAGTAAGRAVSNGFEQAARFREVTVKVATEAAKRSIDSVKAALALIRDKVVNIDIDASKAKKELGSLTKESRLFASAMTALGPAALPILAGLAAGAIGTGAAMASAGAAIGVFGAAFGTAFGEIKKATDKLDTLKEKQSQLTAELAMTKKGTAEYTRIQKELATVNEKILLQQQALDPATRKVADQYQSLKATWVDFVNQNKPAIFGVMSSGFATLSTAIGKLQPLFDIGAAAAQRFADKMASFVNGGGLDRLIAFFAREAPAAINNLTGIAKNLGTVFVNLFAGLNSSGQGFLAWLNQATAKLASWSAGDGFTRFINYLTSNGPTAGKMLLDIAGAMIKIAQAVTPLAPLTLAIASGLAALIKAIPVPVLTTIVGLFVAYNTALVAYNLYTGIAAAATKVWAAAQWLINAAMTANPIGIVVVAIAALVAAIVIAYKNSETFRNIVQTVWAAIKVAIKATVDWFVGTAWPALKAAISFLGDVFVWLWHNVIEPVWNGIKTAISVAWTVIKVLFDAGKLYVQALGEVFMWLWKNIIEPVWKGIHLAIQIAWVAIRVVFGLVEIGIRALALVFQWLWQNVIVPVWNGIKLATQVWWTGVKIIFDAVMAFIRGPLATVWTWIRDHIKAVWEAIKGAVSAAWNWVKDNVLNPIINFIRGPIKAAWDRFVDIIQTAWNRFKSDVSAAWEWVKSKVFDPIQTAITKTIPNAFNTGVNAVKSAWEKIKEAAAAPVRFVVNTVINGGIIKGFNWIAEKVGAGTISPINLGFAEGGVLPGYTPGRDVHKFVGKAGTLNLSGGEAILRPELTRELGTEFIFAANRAAKRGQAKSFLQNVTGGPETHMHFADGGIFGGIVGGIKKAWDTFTDPAEAFKSSVTSLMGGIPGGPFLKGVLTKTIDKLIGSVTGWISDKFNSFLPDFTGGPTGGGSGGALVAFGRWLQSQGYQVSEHPAFGGVTPGAHVNGSKHYVGRAIDVNHGAGTSAAEQRALAAIIPRAHAMGLHSIFMSAGHYNHAHFDYANGGVFKYDKGGWFNPGQIGINQLRQPEAVLTPAESQGLKAMGTDELVDLLKELIEAVREVAPGVGSHIRGSGRNLILKGRSV